MTPAKARALGSRSPQQVGTWWNPASPDDVRAEQKRADAQRAALSASLITTAPTGDPTVVDNAVRAWNALDAKVRAYALEEPSIAWWTRDDQVKRGLDYEAQIEGFRQQFAKLSVNVPAAPPTPPPTPGGAFSIPGIADVAEVLKWGAIAYLAYNFIGRKG